MKTAPRRLCRTEALRRMVRETNLTVDDLIYPMFVMEGERSQLNRIFSLAVKMNSVHEVIMLDKADYIRLVKILAPIDPATPNAINR
ncbi:hypothetical protein [Scytonema sp. UIC 10036]|uniref:hypothetical protein n=1 Tax=Scytonema sp. UIC 10036 TaxID=2304196 RepID=UPI002432EA63|nr:hypothetical protein [Scytonema sp. UIC 10036]